MLSPAAYAHADFKCEAKGRGSDLRIYILKVTRNGEASSRRTGTSRGGGHQCQQEGGAKPPGVLRGLQAITSVSS